MTKKHFKAIAGIIKEDIPIAKNHAAYLRIEHIAEKLADFCATMNPLFDRVKFLKACGIK